jgi:hypothetical protein
VKTKSPASASTIRMATIYVYPAFPSTPGSTLLLAASILMIPNNEILTFTKGSDND